MYILTVVRATPLLENPSMAERGTIGLDGHDFAFISMSCGQDAVPVRKRCPNS